MSEAELDENALGNLLKALDSKQDEERADAIRCVQTLAPATLLALSRLEALHFRRYRRDTRIQAYAALLIIYVLVSVCALIFHARPSLLFAGAMSMICTGIVTPAIICYMNGFQPSQARKSLMSAISDAEAIYFVPVALTLLQDRTADIMPAVYLLLKRLLPQLHAGDAQNWTPKQYQKLLALLADQKQEPELRLSILKALEQIGDARAFATLEALIMSDRTPMPVRQAAADCMPFLQERAVEQRQAQTLLRAAGNTPGTDLLRGASGANMQTPEEQLLRPR